MSAFGTEQVKKRAELVALAAAMIDGNINLIEGARRISSLRFDVGEPDHKVFLPICAVESETDHFPLGPIRGQYKAESLARLDEEMKRYLAEERDGIVSACREIVRTFS